MARVLRRTLATMATVALVLALAGPAAAAKPERVAVPQEDFVISGFCDFDVLVHALASKTFNTTFFDRDGNPTRDLGTGRLVVRMTNVDTRSIDRAEHLGPGHVRGRPRGADRRYPRELDAVHRWAAIHAEWSRGVLRRRHQRDDRQPARPHHRPLPHPRQLTRSRPRPPGLRNSSAIRKILSLSMRHA